jgi:hypothetical protein
MTFPTAGPATASAAGPVAGGPYVAWRGTSITTVIGPAGTLVPFGGGGGGSGVKGATWVSGATLVASSLNTVYFDCPSASTITTVKILTAGGPGSCVLDVWKAPFASFPPLVANSITASDKPTISSGITYQDTVLTGWTTSISAGDVLAFVVNSTSTFTYISIFLEVSS